MRLLFTSYISSNGYKNPDQWLHRIEGYVGILESLAKQHEVIDIERIDHNGDFTRNGVHYIFYKINGPVARIPVRMHRIIKQHQPQVVFINGLDFPFQLMQLRWKLGPSTRFIAINHAEKPGSGRRKLLQQWADRCVDRYLFASSDLGKMWVDSGIISSQEKICEVMEASSSFFFIPQTEAREHTFVSGDPAILWVGRLNENKDPLTVLKAFSNFHNEHPGARLYMIYHTEDLMEQVNTFISRNQLSNAVILKGPINHDELIYWYNSVDMIVSGSHYEGAGMAVCEAMACGCLPVLTDIPSFRMMTENGNCGFLFEPGNEHALLAQLRNAFNCNREQIKERVLHRFNDKLSYNAIANDISRIIEQL